MNQEYLGIDNLEIIEEAKNYNNFLKNEIIRTKGKANIVVDFGAGIGTFAKALREIGVDVICVEPDEKLYGYLQNLGFKVYANLKDIPSGSVGYIYTLNVLEHIEDDKNTISLLYNHLKPDTRWHLFIICACAFNILYSTMDKKAGHFRRYRKRHYAHCSKALVLR